MSGKSNFKNSALAALAVALVATALPASASAEPQRREERGGRARDDGQRGGGDYRARATGQVQAQSEAQARTERPRVERPATGWQGRGNAAEAPRWGSQDRASGNRPGRDWRAGTVNRPAPAERAATPAAPQRERGWDGTRWNPSNGGRVETNRDRDGGRDRNWSGNRDQRDGQRDGWNGRNTTYTDRNRHDNNWRGNDRRDGDRWRQDSQWRGHDRDDRRRWSNDWRRDNRYNWSSYRHANRNHYRMPRYYAPYRGYNYSRLSIGFFLNSGFYGNSYWINDPWSYRLPPAYSGYRWVRYYDDVLLVDTYSGEVVDVIYSFFW